MCLSPHQSPRCLALGLCLLLITALFAGACDRIEVQPLQRVEPVVERHPDTIVIHLPPRFFETLSNATVEMTPAWQEVPWQSNAIEQSPAEGVDVTLIPFSTTLSLQTIAFTLKDGSLIISMTYASPPTSTTLRYRDNEGTRICAVELDLGARVLELELTPAAGDVPDWEHELLRGLEGSAPLSHRVLDEDCAFDASVLDWEAFSGQLGGALSGFIAGRIPGVDASEELLEAIPDLRDELLRTLGLPQGGLALTPSSSGFFSPLNLRLATLVTDTPPWPGGGFEVSVSEGIKMSLDLGFQQSIEAECVTGLTGAPLEPSALPETPLSTTSPTRQVPHDLLLRIDRGLLETTLARFFKAGFACVDWELDLSTTLSLWRTLAPAERETPSTFAQGLRLRIQPLEVAHIEWVDAATLRWRLPALRVHLYGTVDGVYLRIASFVASYVFEVTPSAGSLSALTFEIASSSVEVSEADTTLLTHLSVPIEPEALAEALGALLVEQTVAIGLPAPLGLPLSLIEMYQRDGAIEFYFDAIVPTETP